MKKLHDDLFATCLLNCFIEDDEQGGLPNPDRAFERFQHDLRFRARVRSLFSRVSLLIDRHVGPLVKENEEMQKTLWLAIKSAGGEVRIADLLVKRLDGSEELENYRDPGDVCTVYRANVRKIEERKAS